ncbi:glutathione S-transferase [Dokdonella immobilis]|uniref:Glutathione S-transferase n=1 Tax=Dokdonella immobilis TaxID=578942 RepID=A0A1I4VU97_9GAMM|nr:glutathione S-transferase [Dokdonella immobilis]SFN04740.1 Glutathione S-transferase [Dokdonella immobilis]
MSVTLPVLYSFRRCPYAIRARMAIVESRTRVELREVLLADKPAALLACSPKATVPVLVCHAGAIIDESLDIMLWALRRNDPSDWLGGEAACLDAMLELVESCEAEFKPALDRYKYPQRYGDCDRELAKEQGIAYIDLLERRLAAGGWLFGRVPRLADFAIMPFVRQFAGVEPHWFEEQSWSRLRDWLRQLQTHAAFVQAMHRYRPWSGTGAGAIFPAA